LTSKLFCRSVLPLFREYLANIVGLLSQFFISVCCLLSSFLALSSFLRSSDTNHHHSRTQSI
jgi:hypothetical protein